MSARGLGFFSATGLVSLSVLYVGTGVVWLLRGGEAAARAPLSPEGTYLAVLEWLLVLCAPLMVLLMAALHALAAADQRAHTLAALSFMVLAAGTTSGVHFARLVVARHLDPAAAVALAPVISFDWPSIFFALDLLAWDLFLGLSLVLAAGGFPASPAFRASRIALRLAGALCLAGFLGPATGHLQLQLLAITGYAFVFPAACLCLAVFFRHTTP